MTVKKLIENECANHFTEQKKAHFCCLEMTPDNICPYFRNEENGQKARCIYFEQSVLPLDPQLEEKYYKERSQDINPDEIVIRKQSKAKPRFKCSICNEIFEANSNRQKYCSKCKPKIRRTQVLAAKKKFKSK